MSDELSVTDLFLGDLELRERWERERTPRYMAYTLTALRRASGLTQKDVAAANGWDPAFVSRLESGRGAMPSAETLARYAAACGLRAACSFRGADGEVWAEVGLGPLAPAVEAVSGSEVQERREREGERFREKLAGLRREQDAARESLAASGAPALGRKSRGVRAVAARPVRVSRRAVDV